MEIDETTWRWRMVRAGLSVNELAKTMGKPHSQVSKWLSGKTSTKTATAVTIESIIQHAERKAGLTNVEG